MTTTPAPLDLDLDAIEAYLCRPSHSVDRLHGHATQLLDALATERRQSAAMASITGEAIRQLGEERDAARDELAKTRAELDEIKALSHDYNWQWQLESGVSRIFEGRAAWLYRNSTRMTQMRYDAATAAGYDFTQYAAQMDQPVDRDALIAYLREEIALAEQEIAAIEANPATTAEPADEPKAVTAEWIETAKAAIASTEPIIATSEAMPAAG